MAKKSRIERNNNIAKLVDRYKNRRSALKKKLRDKNVSVAERALIQKKIFSMYRDSSHVRIRRRCAVTGNPRALYRLFGLSRDTLRSYASVGLLPGVFKLSR